MRGILFRFEHFRYWLEVKLEPDKHDDRTYWDLDRCVKGDLLLETFRECENKIVPILKKCFDAKVTSIRKNLTSNPGRNAKRQEQASEAL